MRVALNCLAVAWAIEIHFDGRAECRARAGTQRDDSVGQQQTLVHVVGDQHDGLAIAFPDLFDLVLQGRSRERVQRAERFVEQQHLRIHRECSRNRNSLPHSTGEFVWALVSRRREVDHRDVFLNVFTAFFIRPVREELIDSQRDVVEDVQPRQQRIVLKHDATIRAGTSDFRAVDNDRTLVRLDQPSQ